MNRHLLHIFLIAVFLLSPYSAYPAEVASDSSTKERPWLRQEKVTNNYNIKVPWDMRLERQEGRIFFENINEYVARRFYELQERITRIEENQQKMMEEITALREELKRASTQNSSSRLNP